MTTKLHEAITELAKQWAVQGMWGHMAGAVNALRLVDQSDAADLLVKVFEAEVKLWSDIRLREQANWVKRSTLNTGEEKQNGTENQD